VQIYGLGLGRKGKLRLGPSKGINPCGGAGLTACGQKLEAIVGIAQKLWMKNEEKTG
jgi:hypothetical protein